MDTRDIKRLYEQAFPSIRSYVLKNSGCIQDAEDIFQDAMVVYYKKQQKQDFILTSKPETFLFSIARNIWYKKLGLRKTEMVTNSELQVLIVDDNLDDHDLKALRQRLYRKKFNELSSDCQKVISLFLTGRTMEEIAIEMRYMSQGYAKKKKFKCKEKLLQLIKSDSTYGRLSS